MNALVSYNRIIISEKINHHVVCFENIFNPKQPSSVLATDKVYQRLRNNHYKYERIIVFLGKKSSGSCEMIPLLWNTLPREKIFFVLCHHDLRKKQALLKQYAIPKKQYLCFRDHQHLEGKPCDEVPIMLGIALQKAE